MKYDGTQDPLEHLTAFEARMNLEGVGDEVRFRAFPVTLAGPAIRWFNNLPQGSVTQFFDISHAFLAQFTTRIVKAKHPINLLGVTQRPGEPTRKYLDRFNDECLEIDSLTDSVASLCLTNGLSNEDFRKHLTTKPVWTMQEIQCVAKEYINDEEVSRVVAANKWQPAYNQARHYEGRERPKEHARDGGPSKAPKPFPRVGKFTNYTPLMASITEVYQQIAENGILDGKFADFSHLIREPRRRNRDHDSEDRSRSTRRRQEPEGDDHGLTVVNVVTARNTAPKVKVGTEKRRQGSIKGDLETAVACDHASLSLRKKSKEASGVFLADLDARIDDKPRPEPEGDLEKFRVGEEDDKFTFINRNLPHEMKEPLMEMIRANADLFSWTPADMPGIDPQLISHHLAVKTGTKPVA
nr:uncharacterized protein LOC112749411 [Arachis hypogaea]